MVMLVQRRKHSDQWDRCWELIVISLISLLHLNSLIDILEKTQLVCNWVIEKEIMPVRIGLTWPIDLFQNFGK